jgi:hypothetical protein
MVSRYEDSDVDRGQKHITSDGHNIAEEWDEKIKEFKE